MNHVFWDGVLAALLMFVAGMGGVVIIMGLT